MLYLVTFAFSSPFVSFRFPFATPPVPKHNNHQSNACQPILKKQKKRPNKTKKHLFSSKHFSPTLLRARLVSLNPAWQTFSVLSSLATPPPPIDKIPFLMFKTCLFSRERGRGKKGREIKTNTKARAFFFEKERGGNFRFSFYYFRGERERERKNGRRFSVSRPRIWQWKLSLSCLRHGSAPGCSRLVKKMSFFPSFSISVWRCEASAAAAFRRRQGREASWPRSAMPEARGPLPPKKWF